MDRREFLKLLSAGTLMAMIAPSVAQAFQSGQLTEDELYELLKDGGDGIVTQEAKIVGRVAPNTSPAGVRLGNMVRDEGVEKHTYAITGKAEEREYLTEVWSEAEVHDDDLANPQMTKTVVASTKSIATRKRKFIPGHRSNADGTPFKRPRKAANP